MKVIVQFLGSYAGELILAAAGTVIRKIEIHILKKKLHKQYKETV
jgi:hypothetical protein